MARLTVGRIEQQLTLSYGNVSHAAKSLGVSRTTLYKRINASSTLQKALDDARESMVDAAENALRREVLDGNITAIIFTLKTLGKSRGYVERQQHEVSGRDGGNIVIKWANEVDDDDA